MDSAPPSSLRSRLLTGFAGLLGAFVLYVLSIGPVGYVSIRSGIQPKSVEYFYTPVGWLLEYTPLQQPMNRYIAWWMSRAGLGVHKRTLQTPPEQP